MVDLGPAVQGDLMIQSELEESSGVQGQVLGLEKVMERLN